MARRRPMALPSLAPEPMTVGRRYGLPARAGIGFGLFLAVLISSRLIDALVTPVPVGVMAVVAVGTAPAAMAAGILWGRPNALVFALIAGLIAGGLFVAQQRKDAVAAATQDAGEGGSHGVGGFKAWLQNHIGGDDR
jgi:hypothetical protein